jgi:hypothetical protein
MKGAGPPPGRPGGRAGFRRRRSQGARPTAEYKKKLAAPRQAIGARAVYAARQGRHCRHRRLRLNNAQRDPSATFQWKSRDVVEDRAMPVMDRATAAMRAGRWSRR